VTFGGLFAELVMPVVFCENAEWFHDSRCFAFRNKVNVMAKRATRSTTPKSSNSPVDQASEISNFSDMGGSYTRNDSMASEPSEEEIRMRAYRRYLERGGGDGRDFDDWLEAERELKQTR